jgi:3'(2'), 5'-bisphosphate nucleotidase
VRVTFDPGTPAPEVVADDHRLAVWLAEAAGRRLLEVREEGLEGKELKNAGDQAAHDLLMKQLAEHRPDDAVLSEEGKDDKARLSAERVWIVDPLDGTREFSEPPRDDWAVHVALWSGGDVIAGAVAQPELGETFNTGAAPVVPARTSGKPGDARGISAFLVRRDDTIVIDKKDGEIVIPLRGNLCFWKPITGAWRLWGACSFPGIGFQHRC